MKALISPQETVYADDGAVLGQRVAQVDEEGFEIAQPLFWVDCPDDCVQDKWYYLDGQVFKKPEPPQIEAPEIIELPNQEMEF